MTERSSSRQRRRAAARQDKKRQRPGRPPAAVAWPGGAGDAAALLLVLPLALSLLPSGWFFGHDNMHLIRLFEQDVMVRAGHFPVRWYPDVAAGYGSPHPQYYAPLFYLVAQIFHSLGLSLGVSLKLTVVAVLATASMGMFRLARRFVGTGGGLVAAALYTYAPYHMLDLFVRTAFSELIVFAMLPLALLAFHRLAWGATGPRIAAAAAALGGLCLSHTITVMLVPPLVGGWLLLTWRGTGWRRGFALSAAGAGILGVALAAFFLVPLVAEKGAVDTEIYAAGYFSYQKHFVEPSQILYSAWGHGMSREGPGDGISFRLGLLQMAGCLLAFMGWGTMKKAFPGAALAALFALLVSAAGIFMCLRISAPLWGLVPPLRYVQFPWRFLMLPAFGMPLLGGLGVPLLWCRKSESAAPRAEEPPAALDAPASPAAASDPVPRWAVAAICAGIVVASAGMFGFRRVIPYEQIGFGGDHTDMRARDAAEAAANPTVFTRELIRRETTHWFDHLPHGGYPYPPAEDALRPRAEIAIGTGEIEMLAEEPVRYVMKVRARGPVTMRVNVYRFPGWRILVDGRDVEPGPMPSRRPVLSFEVPPGEHEVEVRLEASPARRAGDRISLAALLGVAGLAGSGLRRRAGPRASAASEGR